MLTHVYHVSREPPPIPPQVSLGHNSFQVNLISPNGVLFLGNLIIPSVPAIAVGLTFRRARVNLVFQDLSRVATRACLFTFPRPGTTHIQFESILNYLMVFILL